MSGTSVGGLDTLSSLKENLVYEGRENMSAQ